MNELPTITSHAYGASTCLTHVLRDIPQDDVIQRQGRLDSGQLSKGHLLDQYASPRHDALYNALRNDPPLLKVNPTMPTRIVRVLIVDPDTRVPLEQRVLHKGDEQLTDLTDQELFYELPIKDLLDQHNIRRSIIIDKAVKDRMAYLDPIRVRDLRMLVVTVADF